MYCLVSQSPQSVSDADDECIKNHEEAATAVSGTINENLKGRSPEPPLLHIRTCLKGSQAK